MRLVALLILAATFTLLSGCARRGSEEAIAPSPAEPAVSQTDSPKAERQTGAGAAAKPASTIQDGQLKQASLSNAQNSQASVTVTERKIIRNAELVVETNDPGEGQRRIASIAESRGGFVVTSESRQRTREGGSQTEMVVTVTVRVPAAQFDAVVNEIRGAGSRLAREKITGQDVTEEYIDLEARIRAKQALEAQFMEIMKQARSVQDALEVQRQLAEVRSEIERLEGRRRFLENQSSLSTITVTLQPPTQIVSTTGFFYSVKRAFGEGLDAAATITLFFIQFFVALLPILIFVVLPLYFIARYLLRRLYRKPANVQTAQPPPTATTAT